MKVLAINGSPRTQGNTNFLINEVLNHLSIDHCEKEIISLGTLNLMGCTGCGKCYENKDMKCIIPNDPINEIFQKMSQADVIILGSPVYFGDVTSNMKAFIERCGMLTRANDNILAHKIGASVVAVRRAGAIHTFHSMNLFYLISQMIIVGSSYWNIGIGRAIGDCENDPEGINTMKTLADNLSWLVNRITK